MSIPARASVLDTVRVAAQVVAPTLATGIIKRRPRMMALAQKFQVDRSAIKLLQRLRGKYGEGPLRLRVVGRGVVLLLSPKDVGGLLAQSPHPFSPATKEKKASLRCFQPHGVLISQGQCRAKRRRLNETVLQPGQPVHELASPWAQIVQAEAGHMLRHPGELNWGLFNEHWWRVVRRVVLGGDTSADREITDLLARLRLDANWAYAHPARKRVQARFLQLVQRQVDLKRPGGLAAKLAGVPVDHDVDAPGQLPHWLFAFDAAGIVTLRALALLAVHPAEAEQSRSGLDGLDLSKPHQLPYLRACVLESVRLWPTTPALLRESRTDTDGGWAGTMWVIYAPLFHRDAQRLPYADRFVPEIWLDDRAQNNPALVPFSAGPAVCPGRNLVLFTASTMLANLLQNKNYELRGPAASLMSPDQLPATLDNFSLRFGLT
jgi:cytochrome P450